MALGALLATLLAGLHATAADFYVDRANGDDANDGLSWAAAKQSIEAALEDAELTPEEDTIRVAEGTYHGRLMIRANTVLLGGFPAGGGERVPDLRPTVLRSGVDIADSPTGQPSRLDGFVITGGGFEFGGGIHVMAGAPVIANCVITGNSVWIMERCLWFECRDQWGDLVWQELGYVTCTGFGSAIFVENGAEPTLWNNLIYGNRIQFGYGFCDDPVGLTCPDPPPDCEPYGQGSIWLGDSSDPELPATGGLIARHNTFVPEDGIWLRETTGMVVLEDNIWWGWLSVPDGAVVRHNLVESTNEVLDPSNLIADPLFVDPAEGDFHLSQLDAGQGAQSPAVDAGSAPAADVCPDSPDLPCFDGWTTRTDGGTDTGQVDIGYHHLYPHNPPLFGGATEAIGDCRDIELYWEAATDLEGDALVYNVYRADSPGAQDFESPVATLPEDTLFYRDTSMDGWNVPYYYVVRARDARLLEEGNTVEVSALREDTEAPWTDSRFSASVAWCDVTFEYCRAGDDCSGLDHSELHRSLVPGFAPGPGTLVTSGRCEDTHSENGLFYYRLLALDRAGLSAVSRQAEARVWNCWGPQPVPGEATMLQVHKQPPAGMRITFVEAPGADFHRLYQGDLTGLRAGYNHGAGPTGPGICEFAGSETAYPEGMAPGSFYFLVSGVNGTGEGSLGFDSDEQPSREATSGPRTCP
jgi:hypothetical protein